MEQAQKALIDLDKAASMSALDRQGHIHIITCVNTIREALDKAALDMVANGPKLVKDDEQAKESTDGTE